jgi:transposase
VWDVDFTDRGRLNILSIVRRKLIERKLKEMLLEKAERENVDPRDVASWLYEAVGVRVGRATWENVRRAILRSDELTAQELAVYLMEEHGVKIDEHEWLSVLRSFGLTVSTSKILGGRGRKHGEAKG